ncbi:MAG: hypothetical protein KIH69_012300 [Anaerolineae bacterium]|nr:hypothetical protein [Anaerolineae bacterium]
MRKIENSIRVAFSLVLAFSFTQVAKADINHDSEKLLQTQKIMTVRDVTLQSKCKISAGELFVDCPENTIFQKTIEDISVIKEVLFYEVIDSEDERAYRSANEKLDLKIDNHRKLFVNKSQKSKKDVESVISSAYCGTFTLNFHALVVSGYNSGGVNTNLYFDKGGSGGYSCNTYKPLSYTQYGQWGIPSWIAHWIWYGDGGSDGWGPCKATPTSGTFNWANWRTNSKNIQLILSNGSGCWPWQQTTTSIYL